MKVNVENMLRQAGQCARAGCERYGGLYDYTLQELAKNLREFRDRHRTGDARVADEFFELYVFDKDSPTVPHDTDAVKHSEL